MFHSVLSAFILLVTLPALIASTFADLFENIHKNLVVPRRAKKNS